MLFSMMNFAGRFSDPFLQRAFPVIQYGFSDVPVLINLVFLAGCSKNTMGWPKGGSLAFARAIEERYLSLGGWIEYNKRVEKILVQDNRATGVLLADGSEHNSEIVVSAADGYSTIFKMLDGKYTNNLLLKYYNSAPERIDMSVHVSLGVIRDMSEQPHALAYLLDEPVEIAGEFVNRLDVEVFNFDDSLAPAGKYVIKVLLGAQLSYWKKLAQDNTQYEAEKRRIADTVINCLEKRFPGLKKEIEMVDVCTPLSVERLTGNWQGIIAPWLPPGGFGASLKGLSRTLPGLNNFYMIGQWGEGMFGLSTVALAARNIVKTICKKDRKRFAAFTESQKDRIVMKPGEDNKYRR